jgi:hypothetical protein
MQGTGSIAQWFAISDHIGVGYWVTCLETFPSALMLAVNVKRRTRSLEYSESLVPLNTVRSRINRCKTFE